MRTLFTTAVFRLTISYLALIVVLSLIFSSALYRVSTQELDHLEARQKAQQRLFDTALLAPAQRISVNAFFDARTKETERSKDAIALNLAYFNLAVVVLGGAAGYALARRTLHPIEEAVEAQKQFTSDASHELRTPLTAMKTEIEVALRDQHLSALEAKRLLKSNLEEVGKLESLSDGLLKLARPDRSLKQVEKMSLRSLVADIVRRLQRQAATKQIHVVQDVADVTMEGEAWGLTELITILLDNALKYSPPNSTVTLTAKSVHKSVVLTVADQGPGIAANDLPHIFKRFYRADQSRSKTAIEGYGLGLSIAERIVVLHGGEMSVKTDVGQGSVFTVKLPQQQSRPARPYEPDSILKHFLK